MLQDHRSERPGRRPVLIASTSSRAPCRHEALFADHDCQPYCVDSASIFTRSPSPNLSLSRELDEGVPLQVLKARALEGRTEGPMRA